MRYESEGVDLDLAIDLEGCSFELDGELLRVTMQFARRDGPKHVYRSSSTYSIWMRNP